MFVFQGPKIKTGGQRQDMDVTTQVLTPVSSMAREFIPNKCSSRQTANK